MHGADMLMTRS